MEGQRNSGVELLRIICMFGIIFMHTFGIFYDTASGIDLMAGIAINSLFNMGVSIFMLISGYYGIRFSLKKLVRLENTILFYSVFGMLLQGAVCDEWSAGAAVKALFPISTRHYWYMSVYMIIFVFSGYINGILDKINKKTFSTGICLLLLFFSVMPTVTYFEIMGDNGKGLANMLLMYLIGRYIRIYNVHISMKKCGGGVCCAFAVTFLLNYLASILLGGVGIFAPFARDNSLTMIVGSIFAFLLFQQTDFYVRSVNKIARCMFAVYLSEGTIRMLLNRWILWENNTKVWYLLMVMTIYVITVMAIGLCVEWIRKRIYGLFEDKIYKIVKDTSERCVSVVRRC